MMKMKSKRRHSSLMTMMAVSMLALSGFLIYWLNQSYLSEEYQLKRDVEHLLMNSVRDAETTILSSLTSASSPLPMLHRLTVIDGSSDSVGLSLNQDSLIETLGAARKIVIKTLKDGADGKIGLNTRRKKLPGMIGYYLTMTDSLAAENELILMRKVVQSLRVSFDEQRSNGDFPSQTNLLFVDADSLMDQDGMNSRAYRDMATEVGAYIKAEDYGGYIFQKLISKLLVALALLLLTAFTFYILYHTFLKEQALAETRSAMMSNITHELNTPITTASIAIESLASAEELNQVKEYAGIAQDELKKMTVLTDRILSGNTQYANFQAVNIVNLINEVIDEMKLMIEDKNGRVLFHAKKIEEVISVDRNGVKLVLFNILENALKYAQPTPKINLCILNKSDHLYIEVQDNGPGISSQHQKHIFDSFYRIPTGDVHDVKGYGLGLANVKKVMADLGGEVRMKSDGENGSTFILKFNKRV